MAKKLLALLALMVTVQVILAMAETASDLRRRIRRRKILSKHMHLHSFKGKTAEQEGYRRVHKNVQEAFNQLDPHHKLENDNADVKANKTYVCEYGCRGSWECGHTGCPYCIRDHNFGLCANAYPRGYNYYYYSDRLYGGFYAKPKGGHSSESENEGSIGSAEEESSLEGF